MSEHDEAPATSAATAADTTSPASAKPRRRLRLIPRCRKGRIISAVALLVAIGVAVWFFFLRPQPATTIRQTTTLSATTLKTTVSASGTLDPARRADLSFSSGTVTSVLVDVGDTVTAGQSLATIDPASLKIAYQSANADLTAAQENLTDLKSSSSSTTAAINAATANVQVKQNAVTQAKTNLNAATMTAPFDGIVAEVNIATGDSKGSSGSGTGSGSSANGTGSGTSATSSSSSADIVLISNGTFVVSTSVSNSDVASIKRGLQAVITPTGATQPVYGTVSSVGVVASSSSSSSSGTSGSSTFPVEIAVTGTHADLLAGSSVTVEIVTAQLTDVIAVPTQALTTANGKTTVTKLVDGKEVSTEVTTGEVIDSQTVITAGLDEGDEIVVGNLNVGNGSNRTSGSRGNDSESGQFPSGQMPDGGDFPSGGQFPGGGQMPAGGPQGGTSR